MAYGVVMQAPVVAANLLVLSAAAWSMARSSRSQAITSIGTARGSDAG